MVNKNTLIIFIFLFLKLNFVSAQTGIYQCSNFAFKSELNPAKDRNEFDTKILTLDLDAISNKYFMWRVTDDVSGQDVFFRWNIKSKIESSYDKENNLVTTSYEVKMEILGVESGEMMYLYKIDDLNDKSLNILIYNSKFKSRQYFYNLKKI